MDKLDKFNSIILATHGGRDKLHKLGQYASMIAVWYYSGVNPSHERHARAFKKVMGDTRRVGYLFGLAEMIPELYNDFSGNQPQSWKWFINSVADVCDSMYFICDTFPFLASFGLFPMKKATQVWLYDEASIRFWWMAMTCRLALKVNDVMRARASPDREQRRKINLQFTATFCMWIVACYYLFPNRPVTVPVAGACGVTNAIIGLYLTWQASK